MRIMGLDVGDKRIGVAISDEKGIISTPLKVIKNDENSGEEIKKIVDKYDIKKIIIGIPYTLKGETGMQARKVFDFTDNVIKSLGVDVDYIDERYTTKIPSGYLRKNAGTKKMGSKKTDAKEIDKFSAGIILADYLEKKRKRVSNES